MSHDDGDALCYNMLGSGATMKKENFAGLCVHFNSSVLPSNFCALPTGIVRNYLSSEHSSSSCSLYISCGSLFVLSSRTTRSMNAILIYMGVCDTCQLIFISLLTFSCIMVASDILNPAACNPFMFFYALCVHFISICADFHLKNSEKKCIKTDCSPFGHRVCRVRGD